MPDPGAADHARFKQTEADVGSFAGGSARPISPGSRTEVSRESLPRAGIQRATRTDGHGQRGGTARVVGATALQWASTVNAKSPTAKDAQYGSPDRRRVVGRNCSPGVDAVVYDDEAVEGSDSFGETPPDWSHFLVLLTEPACARSPRVTLMQPTGGRATRRAPDQRHQHEKTRPSSRKPSQWAPRTRGSYRYHRSEFR